ncbi:MAG: prepilin-type N-terminal cleavage/methylation domain-containing protein, partial [Candidatus Omnitrophica bacterium]|nr:prepilin-type N-terminal cleavage/methylation domain-containing protein [Candidatus Omnitrophota bacterium]
MFAYGKKALTALEIIIVVVILGLLSTITMPNLSKTLAKSRQRLAKTNLQMILNAQKLYRASRDSFYRPESGNTIHDLDEINRVL